MFRESLNDTIVAISTPIGESGIGIVRLSGRRALEIADKIFVSKDGREPPDFKTYTLHYGWIVEAQSTKPKAKSRIIDEVILSVMRAPKSYTKEDIVEINCHGGIVALRQTLDLVLSLGCRLATPGEFTKRAFLNGRIDLAQAEAVLDIIRAKTDAALKVGLSQLKGVLSSRVAKVRNTILDILTILEAKIDFPEEEIADRDLAHIPAQLRRIQDELQQILKNAKQGRIYREGINAVICGKPNAGKSSLLNALLKEERSIVTPIAGTTRDTIEESVDIQGAPVKFVDTAGIIEPRDLVEKKAIERSRKYIDRADLVILVFDGNKRLSKEDWMLIKKLKKKTVVAVVNKMDLKEKIEKDKILKIFPQAVAISAKKLKNIALLEDKIADLVYQGKVEAAEAVWVSNLRHIHHLKEAQKFLAESLNSLDNKLSLEFIAQGMKDALGSLENILGRRFSEGLLERIFSRFCIGK